MKWQDYVERNPEVMCGKPVIKGTRITVELILELKSNGASEEDILKSYPHLHQDQIRAAFGYAAAALSSDELILAE